MQLLDGKALSQSIQLELKAEVEQIVAQGGRPPHLVAVLVGEHPASASYVRNKMRACERANFRSSLKKLPVDIAQEDLLAEIAALNQDPEVDGYILQLPLPAHIDEHLVTQAVAPEKDVDGFHPYNLGQMLLGEDSYLPATPMGMITLLERYGMETSGKEARSDWSLEYCGSSDECIAFSQASAGQLYGYGIAQPQPKHGRTLSTGRYYCSRYWSGQLPDRRYGERRRHYLRCGHQRHRRPQGQKRLSSGWRCRF